VMKMADEDKAEILTLVLQSRLTKLVEAPHLQESNS